MAHYQTIVVGTDFSARAEIALQAAKELAQQHKAERLHLVHVLDTSAAGTILPYDLTGAEREAKEQRALDDARERLRGLTLNAEGQPQQFMTFEVRRGVPALELARGAAAVGADVLVMATQGHGAIKRAIMGSVTTSALGHATCPVLVVGENRSAFKTPNKIMAAVDLSPVSLPVLEHCAALGKDASTVHAVSVFDEPIMIAGDHPFSLQAYSLPARIQRQDEQKDAVEKLAAITIEAPQKAEIEVVAGSPVHLELLEMVERIEPDLLVLGASGHRTFSKALFGSNAARVIAATKVPVLVVPGARARLTEAKSKPFFKRRQKKTPDEQIIYGLFSTSEEVQKALTAFVDASMNPEDISVVMSEETHEQHFKDEDQADKGFAAGSVLGASGGGILGGLASFPIATGVGLLVMGPAVAMGLIGGLVGTLVSYGMPNHDAARLQDAVDQGRTLVAVHTHNHDDAKRAKAVLAELGVHPQRMLV